MSDQDDAQIMQDLADLWASAKPALIPENLPAGPSPLEAFLRHAIPLGAYAVIAQNAVSGSLHPASLRPWLDKRKGMTGMSQRKRVEPDDTWEAWMLFPAGWGKTYANALMLTQSMVVSPPAMRNQHAPDFRLYHASTQQWAEWDEATGAWVESTDPTAQGSVVLPPAIPQEPEQMLLEGVLAELYDSANGSVAQERVGRLLARYQALTGKRAPEFLRGH